MTAYARDDLAEAAAGQGVRVIPAAVHAANCARVRALLAGRADAAELADILGLDMTPPPATAKARVGEHHYHGTLVPPVRRVGSMA